MRLPIAASVLVLAALLPPATATATAAPPPGECPAGALCLWQREDFQGSRGTFELYETGTDSCVPLPAGRPARSLANRAGRPVTTYQSAECDETGEFETYPGSGTWAPRSPHLVRAFKLWES
ncbi:peptidase inhibitor family I36 protein [Streptomyces sp. NPDC001889]